MSDTPTPPRESARDAAAAEALDRLDARHHRPHGDEFGPNVCAAPECGGDWPCDTALAARLARRAMEWIGVNPPLGVGDCRCEDCGQWSVDNVIGITRDLYDPKQHKPSCEWAELAALAATLDAGEAAHAADS